MMATELPARVGTVNLTLDIKAKLTKLRLPFQAKSHSSSCGRPHNQWL